MNRNIFKHTFCAILLACIAGALPTSCVDNDFDDANGKGTFYTATKITAAEFIDANLDRFGMFKDILVKGNWFTTLQTYGEYTVFLPTNEAVEKYLKANEYSSVAEIPVEVCDTLSRSHLINKTAHFTTDDDPGTLMNMDDHFIVFSSDTVGGDLFYIVNQNTYIIEKDDSVTNGVVHAIDRIISTSNEFLPDYIKGDTAVSIFSEALQKTGLAQLLTKYIDFSYTISEDSVRGKIPEIKYGGCNNYGAGADGRHGEGFQRYPEKRYFKYTLFIEPNKVFRENGIPDYPALKEYAKKIYDPVYPEDAHIDEVTDRRNSLNRFIAYHLMDRAGTFADWAPSGTIYAENWKSDVTDAADWWETMAPGQPIRFSRLANGDLYANASYGKNKRDGVRVLQNAQYKDKTKVNPDPNVNPDAGALNGNYLYLENILEFSTQIRDRLKQRMRIDATTLSPDFMNQGARGNYGKGDMLCRFKNDYVSNFKLSDETLIGVHNDDMWWSSYLGNAVCIKGRYDMSFKLPPVPEKGTYEIRLGYVARGNGSTMQVYLDGKPCGIPFNQTIGAWDSRVGFEEDKTDANSELSPDEQLVYNKGIDKTMRNHGYMKAMDSYRKGTGAISFRIDASESLRRILVSNVELDPMKDGGHWLRFRKSDNANPDSEFSFDYIEIVPFDVYNDPNGEDQH